MASSPLLWQHIPMYESLSAPYTISAVVVDTHIITVTSASVMLELVVGQVVQVINTSSGTYDGSYIVATIATDKKSFTAATTLADSSGSDGEVILGVYVQGRLSRIPIVGGWLCRSQTNCPTSNNTIAFSTQCEFFVEDSTHSWPGTMSSLAPS